MPTTDGPHPARRGPHPPAQGWRSLPSLGVTESGATERSMASTRGFPAALALLLALGILSVASAQCPDWPRPCSPVQAAVMQRIERSAALASSGATAEVCPPARPPARPPACLLMCLCVSSGAGDVRRSALP